MKLARGVVHAVGVTTQRRHSFSMVTSTWDAGLTYLHAVYGAHSLLPLGLI